MNQLSNQFSQNNIYIIEQFTPQITICYLYIPFFIKIILKNLPDGDYRCQRPLVFDNNYFNEIIFSENEITKINNFKTLKKQIEWMCGRYTIKKLVKKLVPEIKLNHVEVDYEEFGAPYLKGFSDFNISISHSNDYAVGGISSEKNIQFGLDIEKFEANNFEKSMQVAFSDREKEYLEKLSFSERYTSWTAKEAYLKYIKKGFHENLKSIEVLDNKVYFNGQLLDLKLVSFNIDEDYSLSVVCDKE